MDLIIKQSFSNKLKRFIILSMLSGMMIIGIPFLVYIVKLLMDSINFLLLFIALPLMILYNIFILHIMLHFAKLVEIRNDILIFKIFCLRIKVKASEIKEIAKPVFVSPGDECKRFPISFYFQEAKYGIFKGFGTYNEPAYNLIDIFSKKGIRIREHTPWPKWTWQ